MRRPRSSEALDLLARHGDACRLIAGGTDLILEFERGVRRQEMLVDVSRIAGLAQITFESADGPADPWRERDAQPGGGATPVRSQHAFPLARACWLVGAPQIRNRGTVAGNLVTASPANDTITPLWAMDATVTLVSAARGERTPAVRRVLPRRAAHGAAARRDARAHQRSDAEAERARHVPEAGAAPGAGDQPDQCRASCSTSAADAVEPRRASRWAPLRRPSCGRARRRRFWPARR